MTPASSSKRTPGRSSSASATPANELQLAPVTDESPRRGLCPSGDPVRLLLFDDQHLMRLALKALLQHDPRYVLVGDTALGDECLTLAANGAAQVVIVNSDMHGVDPLSTVRALGKLANAPRTIALGDDEAPDRILDLFRAGVFGFLPKSATLPELRDAIAAVAVGGTYLRPSSTRAIATGLRTSAAHLASAAEKLLEPLSTRERAVLLGIALGHSGREIAEQLGITTKTVDTYRQRISVKTGMHHRSEFVKTALAVGLLAG
jgi:DNA-binding NarL/FixJ family response regulator